MRSSVSVCNRPRLLRDGMPQIIHHDDDDDDDDDSGDDDDDDDDDGHRDLSTAGHGADPADPFRKQVH